MRLKSIKTGLLALATAGLTAGAASAQARIEGLTVKGAPVDGAMGFQHAATELASDIHWLDGMLLVIITLITIFVMALLAVVIVRYNRRVNPRPATFTHNTPIEVAWTVIPIVILVFIGAFSLPVLFKQLETPEADVTVKITGYQWYWGYDYVDEGFGFTSYMLAKDQLAEYGYNDDEYLLATDTAMVVPTGQNVVIQVTGADVIHSWTIPAFGVKQDAVPGRLAELWFRVEEGEEGIYFGQCSELCGKDHAYMPITVKAVTAEEYEAWVAESAEELAGLGEARPIQVAAND